MEIFRHSEYGRYTEELLRLYIPILLTLPQLRDNPTFLQTTIKAVGTAGISDVVTVADLYTQQQIKQAIETLHPDWQFWGEEGSDNVTSYDESKSFLIVTDPIEGTNNFLAKKDDQWGSVLALIDTREKEPVIGIIAHPTKKLCYLGVQHQGTYLVSYDEQGTITHIMPMEQTPEYSEYTYNNSPHFSLELSNQVEKFFSLGEVTMHSKTADELEQSRKTVHIETDNGTLTFIDPESGALEAVRYRGTIYFKTSNEMAAVFVILQELGGIVTDAEGKPWHLGMNTLIAARTQEDYLLLKNLFNSTK